MKKNRKKYFILLNVGLFALIVAIIAVVFTTKNISIESFAKNLLGKNDSTEVGQVNETQEDTSLETEEETEEETEIETEPETEEETEPETEEDVYDTIIISAAGDVTLGRDEDYGYQRSFDHEFEVQNKDYGYFFRNVKHIFEEDDITIVNLETTLTTATKKADKKFRFKADPSYVEILKQGNIEAVSLANNHSRDYLDQGYKDTIATLEEAGIGYFGYKNRYIKDVRGIKVGVFGLTPWYESDEIKEDIRTAIKELKDEGADIIIAMYHWGIERDNYPNSAQKNIGRFTIDEGADLVLGSHPHVLQGIEEYKGKNIVYSLGNFCFGGNKNPSDKDTMIYVHKFNFKNGELISEENETIPASISSVKDRNNYQPTILEGEEKERVMEKIIKFSESLNE
ncbi:MAG: CapA family protein [Clostridiales bacterium]|nr:CapA family protein [Clostridiales bacterium]